MRNFLRVTILITLFVLLASTASAWNDVIVKKYAAKVFATLPDGIAFPEGITINPESGEIYVSTFIFGGDNNKLLRYSPHGKLMAQRDFNGTPLLGLAFNSKDNKVYIANFGASMIQRIPHDFNSSTPVEDVATIPAIGAPSNRLEGNPDGSQDEIIFGSSSFPAPNGLVISTKCELFISDSFQGAIFKIADLCKDDSDYDVVTVAHDGLLATAGFPPFGANGLALAEDESTLFIANTGDDRVLTLDLTSEGNKPVVFAEGINGADGLAFDKNGNLWVAANQSDQILVLNDFGRVVAKLGEFLGIRYNESPRGLLFPASLAINGKWLIVTNLSLPLTPTAGDEPEEDISKYTISRIKIPMNID